VSDKPLLAVVDVDGVLADVRHRLHFVAQRPKDWPAFFDAAPQDPVLEQGLHVVKELAAAYQIVYLSGRPERCRQDTLDWFERHGVPSGRLILRPRNDYRPARVTKVATLDALSEEATVAVLVDDDPLVLEAAQAAGYDVLPATWMPAEPVLTRAQEIEGRT
jgi:hypothetical protein